MSKLTLAKNLLKLNNKLGLLDVGDIVSLASTAYKVSSFSPSEYFDDFDIDMILHREEYERAQRRKTILTAAAVAGGAYLVYKNREAIADGTQKALESGKELAEDAADKTREVAKDAVDIGKDLANKTEDKVEDSDLV